MHSLKRNRLEARVLFAIQQQVHLAITYSELVARINSAPLKKSKSTRLKNTIAAKKELTKIIRYKQSLYQDWKDWEITRNNYQHMSEDYEQQIEVLTRIMQTLTRSAAVFRGRTPLRRWRFCGSSGAAWRRSTCWPSRRRSWSA